MNVSQLFSKLWEQYVQESPEALEIYNKFVEFGEEVVNDHIAFRTFDDPRINVEQLAIHFEKLGYEVKGEYTFESKCLRAKHFEHKTDPKQPKVFISELTTSKFSQYLQDKVKECTDRIPQSLLGTAELLYSGAIWANLDYEVYQKLLAESEYAAWLYVFGFRANHFTVYINELKKLDTITKVNEFLKQNGFTLNTAGGEIKGTPEELLEQSSTMATRVPVKFSQGTYEILNSFYEFAKRYPQTDGSIYQGFIAKSADKLFESTYVGG